MLQRSIILMGVAIASVVVPSVARGAEVRAAGHISTQTTTTLVAGVANKTVAVHYATFCVDGNGAAMSLTLQDDSLNNLIGTSVVYVVNPGQCLEFRYRGVVPYGKPTVAGGALQLVTGTGNGPVEYYVEAIQQ